MAQDVLYRNNGSGWSKSQCKRFSSTGMSDGVVKNSNGSSWDENYPMEQEYTATFNCQWTQGYNGNGIKLDSATWGDNLYVGDDSSGPKGMRSYIGYDGDAIADFIAGGRVTSVVFYVNLYKTSLNGSPDVHFRPMSLKSAPSSWTDSTVQSGEDVNKHFPNKGYGGYAISAPTTFVNENFQGIALYPYYATAEDAGRFTGKSGYANKLVIKVVK